MSRVPTDVVVAVEAAAEAEEGDAEEVEEVVVGEAAAAAAGASRDLRVVAVPDHPEVLVHPAAAPGPLAAMCLVLPVAMFPGRRVAPGRPAITALREVVGIFPGLRVAPRGRRNSLPGPVAAGFLPVPRSGPRAAIAPT